MQTLLTLLLLFSVSVDSIYRVRKFVERPTLRRSAADDDLDMAAAELIFKETQPLKPLSTSSSDGVQGPPSTGKNLPFGIEEEPTSIGAPSAEPTFSELKRTHLEDIEKDEEGTLKSSMIGKVGENRLEDEGLLPTLPTVRSPFPLNDGETARVPTWQQPLKTNGRQIPYDFHVNAEYPQFAPRARGLVGIPDGWNLDKQVDEEFRSGFRSVDFRRRFHH